VGVDERGRALCAGVGGHQTGGAQNLIGSERILKGKMLSNFKIITNMIKIIKLSITKSRVMRYCNGKNVPNGIVV